MATRKLNEFLDVIDSDEDNGSGYDSEKEDLRKGERGSKRQRIEREASEERENDDEQEELKDDWSQDKQDDRHTISQEVETEGQGEEQTKKDKSKYSKTAELPGVTKPLSKKNLVATEAAIRKSGVVYMSRIPPFMKPAKLRSLLEPWGPINRIFLMPEDPASYSRRVRNGGNKRRLYVESWIEFVDKSHAKRAVELLNAKIIGGKKGTYYHDDVWNLRYLKGFKWHNLTEQIAAENAERASRMRAEISKTARENKQYVQNVERAKMLEGIESKKAAKKGREGGADEKDNVNEKEELKVVVKGEKPREFKQTPLAPKKGIEDHPEQVKRVLSKIF
ncbi:hypothetical protein F5884DRAFT_683808 [Xylogone sp. PMI_703]|nr:hypothetical protein F5884DRAFT_683808 [Xylogone sp. PMI_703]